MELSIGIAVFAGLVSFLSPCILPIVPGYLAYLAGAGSQEEIGSKRREIFLNALAFVLGFSTVFAMLGVLLNTLLEAVAYDAQIWLARIGGALIIFFGLYLTGLIKIAFLEQRRQLSVSRGRFRSRYMTSFVFGAAFAAGWTPCVGAVLGGILGIAATQPTSAFALLFAYALGLGLPFLLVGAFTAEASRAIAKVGPWAARLEVVFGLLLVALGVLVFTSQLNRIASFELLNKLLLSN
jgi:cytochrome c-type biogenesis protein